MQSLIPIFAGFQQELSFCIIAMPPLQMQFYILSKVCHFVCTSTSPAHLAVDCLLHLQHCSKGTVKLALTSNCQLACSAGRVQVNVSHEFTELGLLERENAAILNASLRPLADQLLPSFEKAFQGRVDLAWSCCSLYYLALVTLHHELPHPACLKDCWFSCSLHHRAIARRAMHRGTMKGFSLYCQMYCTSGPFFHSRSPV